MYQIFRAGGALLSRAVNIPVEEDLAYVHLSLQSLADSRGECYVLLGKPEKGLEHLQAAQKRLNQKMSRNNCRLLMQQSGAYLAAGQPDACVQQTLKGLEGARVIFIGPMKSSQNFAHQHFAMSQ